jgi:hypothetical protein
MNVSIGCRLVGSVDESIYGISSRCAQGLLARSTSRPGAERLHKNQGSHANTSQHTTFYPKPSRKKDKAKQDGLDGKDGSKPAE